MTPFDWAIVALYVAAALGIGVYFAKRAAAGTVEFFVAGRSLPWYVAGTSMVASTFSSDTPLFVAGMVREQGVYANWLWWSGGIGTLVSVFFFAHLWRRTRAVTEIEFLSRRYDPGTAVDALRVFRALFDGVFINCVIMASVTLAMSKIIVVILELSAEPLFTMPVFGGVTPSALILVALGVAAVLYTSLSGLYGVVYTDLIQFALAMVGAFALAVIVYVDLSQGGGSEVATLRDSPGFRADTMNLLPEFGWDLKTATFFILISVGWWYGAPGGGFFLQRVLATRSERDAMLSLYWFGFCHYVLRSWPWIIVGLASLVYFPGLVDGEQAYPEMIQRFLPVGLKGIMVASLLAAFMSTLDTHMELGRILHCQRRLSALPVPAPLAQTLRCRRADQHVGVDRRGPDRFLPVDGHFDGLPVPGRTSDGQRLRHDRPLVLVADQRVVGDFVLADGRRDWEFNVVSAARFSRRRMVRGTHADHAGGDHAGLRCRDIAHVYRRTDAPYR